ncbi:FAD/NAD(P)-binding protein [Streptococcus penaeicida]|uniref:FAD/NAD(P)-binding protein n=1 Tax=Streptococcus penaeicida TaxID=1765960 RepID=UPI0039EDFC91
MGVSGLAVLLAFSQLPDEELAKLEIYCFDDALHFGRGLPFQEDHASALINSPIHDISFDYRQMGDFVQWMRDNNQDTSHPYVSRALYGHYMSQRGLELMTKLPVQRLEQRVDRIIYLPENQKWQLLTQGQPFPSDFDEVHLACGQLPVLDPFALQGHANYIADPYPLDDLRFLGKWDKPEIAVIGTGLAAVDVIKFLLSESSASIAAFSRSNHLPTVRIIEGDPISWQYLTDQNLASILNQDKPSFTLKTFETLFSSELTALGFTDWEETQKQFLADGLKGLELSLANPAQLFSLQQLASRVADLFTDLWPLMTSEDRRAFQQIYGKSILNLRNPMPEESARVLIAAAKEGRLTIIDAIESIQAQNGQFVLKRQDEQDLNMDVVINATGYHLSDKSLKNATPLLQELIADGLCQLDSFGGLSILPETSQVISTRYGVLENLYAHGALINGTIYQNNSTIKIQKMAERAIFHKSKETS